MTQFKVLIVEDDSHIRSTLNQYLTLYHEAPYTLEVTEAATVALAKTCLHETAFDLLLSDINLPDGQGFEVIEFAKTIRPTIKVAMITSYSPETYIHQVKAQKIYNVIIKSAPFYFDEFSRTIDNLLYPEHAFGLEQYLTEAKPLQHFTLSSTHQIAEIQQALTSYLKQNGFDESGAYTLALIEAITNALYHSAKTETGALKYLKGDIIEQLDPAEAIEITLGADAEKMALSITDQGGMINPDSVLYWLERNITGENLLDESGRGLFLMHKLIHRFIINVERNKRTEIILIQYRDENTTPNRPVSIYIL
jgi:DNA-binding NarL/FixJ family response regulator